MGERSFSVSGSGYVATISDLRASLLGCVAEHRIRAASLNWPSDDSL